MEQDEQETTGRERRADGQAAARMLRAVLKAWPILVAAALLGAGIAMAASKAMSPVYEAITTIEFDPQAVRPLASEKSTGLQSNMLVDTAEYYNTQNLIMSSDKVLAMVVRDLNLTTDAEFLKAPPTKPVTTEEAVLMLRPRVKVDPLIGSHMVALRVQDSSPRMARKLSEAVARAYIRQNLEKSSVATAEAVVWLGGQLDHFKVELEANENQLHEFKSRNQLPSSTLEEVSKMIRMEMADYQQALTRTRTRRQELAARVAELRKVDADNPDRIRAIPVPDDIKALCT